MPVAANSGVGVAAAAVIDTGMVPLLVTVTGRAVLVVPTVCVLKVIDVTLRAMLGVAAVAAVPVNVIAGLVAAFDCSVKVAVRLPAAVGVKVALIVQVPPAATETDAPTHVPVALNSAALAPVLAIPVMLRAPPPELVSVMLAGDAVEFVTATWVEPNDRVVPDSVMTGPLAAAGLTMNAAMSAACWAETVNGAFARNFISFLLAIAFRIAVAVVPFSIPLSLRLGSGLWHVPVPQLSGEPLVLR